MKRLLTITNCIILNVIVYAQSTDTLRKYLDADLRFTNRNNGIYPALCIRQNDHWMLMAVNPADTTMVLKMYFRDEGFTIKDGPYQLYHTGNVKAQEGYFDNNLPHGLWQSWHPNGQLKDSGILNANRFAGTWKYWHSNGQLLSIQEFLLPIDKDKLAKTRKPASKKESIISSEPPAGTRHGTYQSWYKNGRPEAIGQYAHDTLVGNWVWYDENGMLSTKETYINGKVTKLECYDEKGVFTGSTCSILKAPSFIHPYADAQEYIVNELHQRKNKDIKNEGVADLYFTVTKEGKLADLVIKNSPDTALSKHILSVVKKMPGWSPAVTHNRAIDFPIYIKIPFFRNPDE